MKRIVSLNQGRPLFFAVAVLLMGQATIANAGKNECWVDFYESPNYSGAHVRIEGPAKLRNLRSVDGENWESRIDSLIVGPKARLWVYENTNYKLTLSEMSKYPDLMKSLGISKNEVNQESEITFSPNERNHHLGELNFHKKTKSLKIECVK